MSYFSTEVVKAAQDHAKQAYPLEACGIVVRGEYHRMENKALDPSEHKDEDPDCQCKRCSFRIDSAEIIKICGEDPLEAVVHSHPDGPLFPSESDMRGQITSDVPWVIIGTDGDRVSDPIEWGDSLPVPPILGRRFIHGVQDCYSLIRDTFRLGKEKLAEQDIDWPFDPIYLADCPREDCWWEKGQDLYLENFKTWGFTEISMSEAQPGDVFIMKLLGEEANHAGMLLSGNLVLHHLPGETRISRREPAGGWARMAVKWVRYQGAVRA